MGGETIHCGAGTGAQPELIETTGSWRNPNDGVRFRQITFAKVVGRAMKGGIFNRFAATVIGVAVGKPSA